MIKDVVFHLGVDREPDPAAEYAVSVAQTFGAHLSAVAYAYEPVLPATMMGGGLPVEFIDAQRAASERAAGAAVARFEDLIRRSGIAAEARPISSSPTGAADLFGHIARRFDLSIVGQTDPDAPGLQDLIIETALFQSGRPVLVVPYIQKGGLSLEHVMVCWDGSRNAARAMADALPFLARARAVDVVVVTTERLKGDELPGADVAQHLARHGLTVDLRRIVAGDVDVANTLLSHAADSTADFMVMGGYGHSRLREFVLGGVTRSILAAMTVPTLLSH